MNASALVAKSRRALNTVSTLYMVGPLRHLNPNVATVATRNTSRVLSSTGGGYAIYNS